MVVNVLTALQTTHANVPVSGWARTAAWFTTPAPSGHAAMGATVQPRPQNTTTLANVQRDSGDMTVKLTLTTAKATHVKLTKNAMMALTVTLAVVQLVRRLSISHAHFDCF